MPAQIRVFKPRRTAGSPTDSGRSLSGEELYQRLGIVHDRAELVKQVQRGFPTTVLERLADELGLTRQELLRLTRIAPATLTRRRNSDTGLLSPEESDRIYRVAAAYRDALQLFEGDADSARRWLAEPAKALGGATPLQRLETGAGADDVRDLIGRLEHGVYG